ncbi:hypothetical protein [Methanopyrus sp.]
MIAVLPIAILTLVAVPAHADHTETSSSVVAWGDDRVLKDVKIEVEVRDEDTGQTVVDCVWDGEHDSPGSRVCSGSELDRIVREFSVRIVIRYKSEKIYGDSVSVETLPDGSVWVRSSWQVCMLPDENARVDFPRVEALVCRNGGNAGISLVSLEPRVELSRGRVTVAYEGSMEVGGRRIAFTCRVTVATRPVTPTFAAPTLPLARCLFVNPELEFPTPGRVDVTLSASSEWMGREIVTMILPDRRLTLDSDCKRGPSHARLTVPTGPITLRVDLYYGDRPVASYEYTVQPGPVIVNPFGPHYLGVSIREKTIEVHGDVHAYGPFVFHPSDSDPTTTIAWYYWYYPKDEPEPATYEVVITLATPESIWSRLGATAIAEYTLTVSNVCLVKVLSDTLHVPPSLVYGPSIVPSRLPLWYSLVGLAACLTTVAVRHEMSLLLRVLSLTSSDVPADMAALPLGVWGLRLIAAATGLPTPLAGIAARFVQWVLDEVESSHSSVEWWEVPRLLLGTPIIEYLGRILEDPNLPFYVLQGALIGILPVPLGTVFYLLSDYGPGFEPVTSALLCLAEDLTEILQNPLYAPFSRTALLGMALLPFYVNLPRELLTLAALPALILDTACVLLALDTVLHPPTTTVQVSLSVGTGPSLSAFTIASPLGSPTVLTDD